MTFKNIVTILILPQRVLKKNLSVINRDFPYFPYFLFISFQGPLLQIVVCRKGLTSRNKMMKWSKGVILTTYKAINTKIQYVNLPFPSCDNSVVDNFKKHTRTKLKTPFKWKYNNLIALKTRWQKEKILVLSNFFFCRHIFKRLSAAEASESVYTWGKGLSFSHIK